MNWNLFLRYFFEFALACPAAVFCYLPMWKSLRIHPFRLVCIAGGSISLFCLAASFFSTCFSIPSKLLLIPALFLAFWGYRRALTVSLGKALFVFLNALTMISWCSLFTVFIVARQETGSNRAPLLLPSALFCLGAAAVLALLTAHLMICKVGYLIQEFHVEKVWYAICLLPAVFAALFLILQPVDSAILLQMRLRPLGFVLIVLLMLLLLFLYQLVYMIAVSTINVNRLEQENQILSIQTSRYEQLRRHMAETQNIRHDFRQHIRVLSGLAEKKNYDRLTEYLKVYSDGLDRPCTLLCANTPVDAIAGYYAEHARALGISIDWQLELPEKLPAAEADFCMLLGTLLENSIQATAGLPDKDKRITVICRMPSTAMLALVVENPYQGQLKKDGPYFISTRHKGRGIGLQSVRTTVQRYKGQMIIQTDNHLFSVNIILNV